MKWYCTISTFIHEDNSANDLIIEGDGALVKEKGKGQPRKPVIFPWSIQMKNTSIVTVEFLKNSKNQPLIYTCRVQKEFELGLPSHSMFGNICYTMVNSYYADKPLAFILSVFREFL